MDCLSVTYGVVSYTDFIALVPPDNIYISSVTWVFQGGRADHPDDQNDQEDEENLRKNERKYMKMGEN